MRTETRTVLIGEWLGPVDWTFDFDLWSWDRGGSGNPTLIEPSKLALRQLERWVEDGKRCEVGEHGGWHEVIQVGMYDGWPFWRPVPSVLYRTFLGAESTSWFGIAARLAGDRGGPAPKTWADTCPACKGYPDQEHTCGAPEERA